MSKIRTFAVVVDSGAERRFQEQIAFAKKEGLPFRTVADVLADARDGHLELEVAESLKVDARRLFAKTGNEAWKQAAKQRVVRVPVHTMLGADPELPAIAGYELDLTDGEAELLGYGHPGSGCCSS